MWYELSDHLTLLVCLGQREFLEHGAFRAQSRKPRDKLVTLIQGAGALLDPSPALRNNRAPARSPGSALLSHS